MKKIIFLLIAVMPGIMPMNAHDFEAVNDNGVTIYYKLINRTQWSLGEAVVTYKGDSYSSYDEYSGVINIPRSVFYGGTIFWPGTIGENAFRGCENLTGVTIPESFTKIERGAFSNCRGLTEINVAGANPNYSSENGVLFNKDKTTLIQCPAGKTGICTIPESVTTIGSEAFQNCTKLTYIDILASITEIEMNIFRGCSGLTNITIPNSVTLIGAYAFEGCNSLTNITISGKVTSIGDYAFRGCTGLREFIVDAENSQFSAMDGVLFNKNQTILIAYPGAKASSYTIPDGVTSIGNGAFYSCTGFTNIIISESVTSIGDFAFYNSGLTNLVIGNNVSTIGICAFAGCYFTSVIIPDNVVSIRESAFLYCSDLASIVIGNKVASIGAQSFRNCENLKEIHSLNPIPPNASTDIVFENVTLNGLLYVPKGSLDAYRAADVWKDFANIIEEDYSGIQLPEITQTVYIYGNTIYIDSPYPETVSLYSLSGGQLLHSVKKTDGKASFDIQDIQSQVVVISGSSGWVKKLIKK